MEKTQQYYMLVTRSKKVWHWEKGGGVVAGKSRKRETMENENRAERLQEVEKQKETQIWQEKNKVSQ